MGAKTIMVHLVAVAMLMLVINMELESVWVNGQQTLAQCLGKCGEDAFACFTGCASDRQQDLASCIGCLSACAATTPTPTTPAPAPAPPSTPS